MAAIFRKASSSNVFLRAIYSPRILSRPVTNAFNDAIVKRESSFFVSRNFFTDSKELTHQKLVDALKPKINHPKFLSLEEIMPVAPPDFPFTIKDDPCSEALVLRRDLDGEKIEVIVRELFDSYEKHPHGDGEEKPDGEEKADAAKVDGEEKPDVLKGDSEEKPDADKDEEGEEFKDPSDHVMLYVNISKENGKEMTTFEIKAIASERCMTIIRMSISEKREYNDCEHDYRLFPMYPRDKANDELESALKKYIGVRGIDQTTAGFGSKYLIWKSKRDRKLMLEKVNKFVVEKFVEEEEKLDTSS